MFWPSSQQILSGFCQIGTVGGQPFSYLGERFIEMSGLCNPAEGHSCVVSTLCLGSLSHQEANHLWPILCS